MPIKQSPIETNNLNPKNPDVRCDCRKQVNFRTAKAYLAQCKWRHRVPTWAGLRAFSVPLKLTRRIIDNENITKERSDLIGTGAAQ